MIQNARALTTEHVPQELHHREEKIDHLSSVLQPLTDGLAGEHAIISGPSGTGKTTIAKYVVHQLQREALDVTSGYVNCISDSTKSAALHTLLRDAGRGADLRVEGTRASAFINRFREIDGQFVAIIDEVDILEDPLMLLSLYEVPHVSMLLVTVDEDDLFADLDSRVKSRIHGAARVELDRYSHQQMCDILSARVVNGLAPGVVERETVEYIADVAAGDARMGITLLRRTVKRAMVADRERITIEDVKASEESAREVIHERNVSTLSTHQRHLYEIIKDAGELTASELHDRYEARVGEPRAPGTRRRYIRGLERYKMVRSTGEGRGTRYEYIGY